MTYDYQRRSTTTYIKHTGKHITFQDFIQSKLDMMFGEDLIPLKDVSKISDLRSVLDRSVQRDEPYPNFYECLWVGTYPHDNPIIELELQRDSENTSHYSFAVHSFYNHITYAIIIREDKLDSRQYGAIQKFIQELKQYKELKQSTGGLQDIFNL